MKVFFIFDMKLEFVKLYQDNKRVLFNILKQIYFLDRDEIQYGQNLFYQLINKIDKESIDTKIYIDFHRNISYSKRKGTHYINNIYRGEISRMSIKSTYIKLETEQEFSTFFEILKNFSNNYFVCDFENQDFFFITELDSTNFSKFTKYAKKLV